MAFNRFEQSLVDQYTNTQFPDLPPEPEQPMQPPGTQPGDVLMAEAGSRGLPESAYTGQTQAQMTAYDPTVRERLSAFLQAGLEGIGVDRYTARKNAQTIIGGPSSNLPLTMGIADIIPFLGTALQTQESFRMGEDAATSLQQGRYGAAALEAAGAGLGMIPGIGGTVKGLKKIAPMIPKDVPVGASTDVVGGGTQAMLQAGKASAPVSDIGFYSAVEDAALNIQRKSGSGQAMLNDITKAANVKADEIKWIGLDDFLKGKKNVTKEEVQQFIAQNKVDVQEVQLADVKPAAVSTENITSYFDEALTPNGDEARNIFQFSFTEQGAREPTNFTAYELRGGTIELYDNRGNFIDEYGTIEGARNHVWNESQFAATQAEGRTKFGTYTLPGGENYREILLTMPNVKGAGLTAKETERLNALVDKRVGSSLAGLDDAEQKEYFALIKKREESASGYKSSHWDQPNVLAHIRVNDRVDADGKKMLLVEEVQSDWHQAGRDKGYRKQGQPERLKGEVYQLPDGTYGVKWEDGSVADLGWGKAHAERLANEGKLAGDVPDAPMKDTWYQLALKRVLKYAADNGYERVGLTTGSRQAERYDLSKHIGELYYWKDGEKYGISAYDLNDSAVIDQQLFTPSQLKDAVGKELAEKIMKGEGQKAKDQPEGVNVFRGLDLQVGGEGMKKYYDEVYPQFLAKYGKKWGAKMGETKINLQGDLEGFMPRKDMQVEPVRYIDITPQMRESVGKGQPLFTATGLGTGTAATMQDKEQK